MTVTPEQVKEALEKVIKLNEQSGGSTVMIGTTADTVIEAARLWSEAEPIWWCDVHEWIWTDPDHFYRCSVGSNKDEDCGTPVEYFRVPVSPEESS